MPRLKEKGIYSGGNLKWLILQISRSIVLVVISVKDIQEARENVNIEDALQISRITKGEDHGNYMY